MVLPFGVVQVVGSGVAVAEEECVRREGVG